MNLLVPHRARALRLAPTLERRRRMSRRYPMETRGHSPQPKPTMPRAADGCIAVPSVGDLGSSSSGSPGTHRRAAECPRTHEREYVQAVLEYYLWLPGTASVTSRHDRRSARMLFAHGVPLDLVKSAMV